MATCDPARKPTFTRREAPAAAGDHTLGASPIAAPAVPSDTQGLAVGTAGFRVADGPTSRAEAAKGWGRRWLTWFQRCLTA